MLFKIFTNSVCNSKVDKILTTESEKNQEQPHPTTNHQDTIRKLKSQDTTMRQEQQIAQTLDREQLFSCISGEDGLRVYMKFALLGSKATVQEFEV